MKWIEDHIGLMVLLFLCIFAIQLGIGAWRLPKEFRSRIIPKLNRHIYQYRSLIEDVEYLNKTNITQIKRINMLMDLERQRAILLNN